MSSADSVQKRAGFFDTSNLRGDFFGGLTAGIVALPLGSLMTLQNTDEESSLRYLIIKARRSSG